MGNLMVKLGGVEVGILTEGLEGVAGGIVGETAGEGPQTGRGEGFCGLLATGEGERAVFLGFTSLGMNGSGKNREPGVITKVIWKGTGKIRS